MNASPTPPAPPQDPAVGVDVVHVPRLARALTEQPALADVLFTESERTRAAASAAPVAALALCFAAQEALLKALGTGLSGEGPDARLQQVALEGGRGGTGAVEAHLTLDGRVAERVARGGWSAPQVALTRTGEYALATVLLWPRGLLSAGRGG